MANDMAMETNTPLKTQNVFVLHVKHGYEERYEKLKQMLDRHGITFEPMLDGDIDDIDDGVLDKWFSGGEMRGRFAHTSCALKHLLIYEAIIKGGLDGALVLEDDIRLHGDFNVIFNKSMEELAERYGGGEPVMVSYEDTRLRFVPQSVRRKGQVLYEGDRDRMAGAYYVNRAAAELMVRCAEADKVDIPIDLFHNKLLREKRLTYLWCQPTVATQGTAEGRFASSISSPKGALQPLIWKFKLTYKKLLYFFR